MGALGSVLPLLLLLLAVLLVVLLQVVAAAAPRSQPPSAGEARIGEWGAGRGARGAGGQRGRAVPSCPRELPASHGRPRPSSAHLAATGPCTSPPGSPAPSRLSRPSQGAAPGWGMRLLGTPPWSWAPLSAANFHRGEPKAPEVEVVQWGGSQPRSV